MNRAGGAANSVLRERLGSVGDVTMRIVVAEDNYLVREGIVTAAGMVDGVEIVATCESYDELLAAVDENGPDVVVTDIRMPPTQTDEGIRAAQHLRTTAPHVGVVVLSQHVESAFAVRLFTDGSEGRAYLLKERVGDVDELAHALRTVADGGTVVDPVVVEALVGGQGRPASSVLQRLTEREHGVLGAMATGASNVAIAEQLFISPRSVEKHISSIFTKLDLPPSDETHRRVQAVLIHLDGGTT